MSTFPHACALVTTEADGGDLATVTDLAAAAVTACGSGEPATPATPPTFEEEVRAAGIDEVVGMSSLRDMADILCDGLRGGVTRTQALELLVDETELTRDQAADMLDIAIRHECEDPA